MRSIKPMMICQILAILILSSCGLFKVKEKEKQKNDIVTVEKTESNSIESDTSGKLAVSKITYKGAPNPFNSAKGLDFAGDLLALSTLTAEQFPDAVKNLQNKYIDFATSANNFSTKATEEHFLQEKKGIHKQQVLSKDFKQDLKSNEVKTDSDSTAKANIPWYAWVIGIIGILGLLAFVLFKIRR